MPSKNNKKYSKLAIASGVMGLFGLFLFGPFLTIPALIAGIFALKKIKKEDFKGEYWAKFGIGAFIIQSIFLVGILGYATYKSRTAEFQNMATGEEAIEKMTEEETYFLDSKLKQITSENTKEDVISVLGEPRSTKNPIPMTRFYYDCPANSPDTCGVIVDFIANKAFKIGFMDVGRFSYSIKLNENK